MNEFKTIFITSFYPLISRNILSTDALKLLKDKKDLRIVILAPTNKKEFIEKNFGGDDVIVEGFDAEPIFRSRYNKFWYRLAFLFQNSRYVKDQRGERLWRHRNPIGYFNYFIVSASAFILSNLPLAKRIYRFLDYHLSPRNVFSDHFKKYNPSMVFCTDIFGETDILLMREARARGIFLLGMVRSWDNTTTKGVLRLIPDRIIVNGLVSKKELVKFHNCKPRDIYEVGLPQFDNWLTGPTMTREEFFQKIGADPSKKLILLAPAGAILSDTDWQLCQILKDALDNGSLPLDIQFLVRNHPHHPADLGRFTGDPRFIIEIPGKKDTAWEGKLFEFNSDDNDHLRNSVYYSEMIMYVATSLGLDATVYNKPQIMISFDGWEERPYVKSVKRFNREDCLAALVKLGGTKVVKNKEEWIKSINDYLKDPILDNEGRKKTVEEQMYKLDGKSGQRIADIIIQNINVKTD